MAAHAQLYATEWIRLDQVHEFPEYLARRKLFLNSADACRRNDALQKAADGACHAYVYLRYAHFHVAIGALIIEVDIVHADHFPAAGIDNLLIEQVFADG